ncbi:LTA synthase family protein [Gorillibacterium massiliense]|uniref:LTA synthase family protein n=1 Tax=Gorillibacterium massiliense TaxID=1280390 RepID=UPI00307B7280
MTLLIVLKLQLYRGIVFHETGITQLLTDIFSVVMITALVELIIPKKIKGTLYVVGLLLISIVLFAAAVYYHYFGTVPTYTTLSGAGQLPAVSSSVQSVIQLREFLFFADFAIGIVLFIVLKVIGRKPAFADIARLPRMIAGSLVIVGLAYGLTTWFVSGDTVNEMKRAELLGFPNYQASVILKDITEKKKDSQEVLSQMPMELKELSSSTVPTATPTNSKPNDFGVAQGKNLLIIQVEALQNFPINLVVNGQEITPNLNKLTKEGLYFPHVFQQIGQGNTSDAEFMSNTSIYPTGTVAMSTGFGNRDIPSLPKVMAGHEYTTMTFHVNDVTFWDRNKLYPALGFEKYFDKPNFENDHFNALGASDDELYKVAIQKLTDLQNANQPFYAQFVTLSSHHPFKIPENYQTLNLPDSLKGKQLGDYLQAVHYTDEALGRAIQKMKDNGLWDNTVVAIYGDHFGLQPADNKPDDVEAEIGIKYDPKLTRFNIPLIIHAPGAESKVVDQVGGQVDIMPTLANLLGISLEDEGYVAFGHDLLNIKENVIGMRYYLPTGSFFNDKILFVPGKGFDDGTAIDIRTMEPVTDFSQYRKDYDYVLNLEKLSDTYVSALPKRE